MLAPQAENLLNHSPQVSTRMRDCFLTTQFGPQGAFQAGHKSIRSVQLCTVSLFCALPILYCRKLPKSMNGAWYPDELTQYWRLALEDRNLLGSNTPSATQLRV